MAAAGLSVPFVGEDMSPELETLDQLLTGEMPLRIVRRFFADDGSFKTSIYRMVENEDIELRDENGRQITKWQLRELMSLPGTSAILQKRIAITENGVRRIA